MALALFFTLCGISAFGQDEEADCWSMATTEMAERDYQAAIGHLRQCVAQAESAGDDTDWASAHTYISYCQYRLGELDSMRHYNQIMDDRLDDLKIRDKAEIGVYAKGVKADMYYIIGLHYYTIGWYSRATRYYERALKQLLDTGGETEDGQPNYLNLKTFFSFEGDDLLNNLGSSNYEVGNYKRSAELYQIAKKRIREKSRGELDASQRKQMARLYNNLAIVLLKIGQAEEGLSHSRGGLEGLEGLEGPEADDIRALLHRNLGYYQLLHSQKGRCIEQIRKGLQYAQGGEVKIKLYQLYAKAADADERQSVLDSLKALVKRHYGPFHPYTAKNYELIGDFSRARGDWKQAEQYYNQAINALRNQYGGQCPCQSMEGVDLADFYDLYSLLEVLEKKSGLLQRQDRSGEALACYRFTARLLLEMQQKYLDDTASKYLFSRKAKKIYQQAIRTALALGETETAHHFCQQGKRMVMLQQMGDKRKTAKTAKGDSPRAQLLEATHRYEIAKFTNDSAAVEKWRDIRFSRNQDYEDWREAQGGAQARFHPVPAREIQRHLARMGEGACLVEYFLGEGELFRFKADAQGLSASTLPLDSSFQQAVDTFIRHTHDYIPGDAAFGHFHQSAHQLYRWLLGGLLPKPDAGTASRLIIIPDEQLNEISFAALASLPHRPAERPASQQDPGYLVRRHDISYLYSCRLLSSGSRLGHPRFLGVAPSFPNGKHPALENTGKEVEEAAAQYEYSRLLLGPKAAKNQVEKILADYDIVQLATHAYPNRDVPFDSRIALADTSLFLYELLSKDWAPDLVLLSSCHTAAGKRLPGEGVLSLASACIQTGSAAVLSSLWQAEDSDARKLSGDFHQKLAGSGDKDWALASAQRKHLEYQVSWKTHPHYWSGFILTGSPDAIVAPPKKTYRWLSPMLAFATLTLVILAWREDRKGV